jgi:hypothetical protein
MAGAGGCGLKRRMNVERYFLTVDWCKQGKRGIFCSANGKAFPKDEPHTQEEMDEILGLFWLVLNPQSTLITEEEIKEYNRWTPLDEYSGAYGVARRTQ